MRRLLPLLALGALALVSPLLIAGRAPEPQTIATLPIPGPQAFVGVARDVVDVAASVDPSLASSAGLFQDSVRVPSYSEANLEALTARLDRDLSALRSMPWRSWAVDVQIDLRWTFAVALTLRRQLQVERLYERRPAQWLEPIANNLVALQSYAPDQPALQDEIYARLPAVVAEARTRCTNPTRRDLETGVKLATALAGMAEERRATPAAEALRGYALHLGGLQPTTEHAVIGAESYAWRLQNSLLLPWTPDQLLVKATADLEAIDARLRALAQAAPPAPAEPTAEQRALAARLDGPALRGVYDDIELALRAATVKGGWVTIPEAVGPIHARETPDAIVPLTGDGGSMNPPPTYASSNVGWWNVEHFNPTLTEPERLETVFQAQGFFTNGMGPYAAHEGFPGHHLQLSIARLHPDPLRSILPDAPQNEGWALYAEEALWLNGGFGSSPLSEAAVRRSNRSRIARVIYDVNIESGRWTLQQAADFKGRAAPGQGRVDEDILRSINWPTQLIAYYSGKAQIVALREAMKAKLGPRYDDRAFHDALLAEGSIPIALIRAKMLGEPIPDLPAP